MDGILSGLSSVGQWAGLVLWVLLGFTASLGVFAALPGGWIAFALTVLYDFLYGFDAIGWPRLIIFAVLLGVGEGVELVLGSVYVAKKGASKKGILGSFLGVLGGAILGSILLPVIGSVVGAFVGAFVGAVLGEHLHDRRAEPNLRVGLHATIGRMLSITVKYGLTVAGLFVAIQAAWVSLAGGVDG